jgi:hypothetical protein
VEQADRGHGAKAPPGERGITVRAREIRKPMKHTWVRSPKGETEELLKGVASSGPIVRLLSVG